MLPVSFFNVVRYLTDSLRGPVLQTLRRARSASLMGLDGWDGLDRWDELDGLDGLTVTKSVL